MPAGWRALPDRWEAGHAVGFVLFLAAFVLLVVAALQDRGGR